MIFLHTLINLFRPSFYFSDLRHRRVLRGIGFLFVVGLILMVADSFYYYNLALQQEKRVVQFAADLDDELTVWYPAELVLNFKDNIFSTNVELPYYIDFKTARFKSYFRRLNSWLEANSPPADHAATIQHLIAIDTSPQVTDLEGYQAVYVVSRSGAVAQTLPGHYTAFLFSESPNQMFENLVFDRARYEDFLYRVRPMIAELPQFYKKVVGILALVLPLPLVFLWISWHLIYLLPLALIPLILGKILKKSVSYREGYVMALYASAIPLAITTAITLAGFTYVPFLFSALLVGVLTSAAVFGSGARRHEHLF